MTPDYGTLLQSGFAALARGAPADALRIAETARARQPGEGNAHFPVSYTHLTLPTN